MSTRKVQDFILKDQEVSVGPEEAKRTWKICVRSRRRVVHQAGMEAKHATGETDRKGYITKARKKTLP